MIEDVNEAAGKLQYVGEPYYQDSMMVTMTGMEVEPVKILTVFTTIDFSNNDFRGETLESIGKLRYLRVLNFTHNSLSGRIPPSLGSLSNLEWLDLSSNKLVREIPTQLSEITTLSFLNLSENQLVGSIPQGNQFNTFYNDSYGGNLGLCGFPSTKKCDPDLALQPQSPSALPVGDDDYGFGWKAVVMEYACGILLGMVIGHVVFKTGKREWLVKMVDATPHGKLRRPNPNSRPRRR